MPFGRQLSADPNSPLLNRALHGKYPPGTVISPFLLAEVINKNLPLPEGSNEAVSYKGRTINCSLGETAGDNNLSGTLKNGCPHSLLELGRNLGKPGLYDLFSKIGFYKYPEFIFPGLTIIDPGEIENLKAAAIGQESLNVTPLQMVLASAAISAEGEIPNPILAPSYQLPSGQWQLVESITIDQLGVH